MKHLFITFFLFIGMATAGFAQSLFESESESANSSDEKNAGFSLNGYMKSSVYGGGKEYNLATTFAELVLQGKLNYKNAFLQSDIRLREGLFFNSHEQQYELTELYGGYRSEKFDLLLGNQIVLWGRTDGFNPTDNITPTDYFFLTPDPEDQQLSNFMLRMKYRFTPTVELELIGIPFYKPSEYRFDLFNLNRKMVIENVPMPPIDMQVQFDPMMLPERKLKNGSIAARLNFELPVIGFSLSYFRGYDPFHGFDLKNIDILPADPAADPADPTPPMTITYVPESYLKNTIGGDFAIPVSTWIFRGEMAYNIIDNKEEKPFIPNSDLSYVFGIEKNWNDFIIIGQYIGKRVKGFKSLSEPTLNPTDPASIAAFPQLMTDYETRQFNRKIFNQQEKSNHALALTLSRSFAYEVWKADLTGYYNLTNKEWMIRPALTWKISDALALTAGGQYMKGPDKSIFSYSSRILNGAFAELKVSF